MIEYENLSKLNLKFKQELKESFNKTLENGWYVLGDNVNNFEREFAKYCESNHCSGVASGLDALTISIAALNLPAGSEIIVPSNTYIATILAIIHNKLTPILVEPDIKSYNIDPKKIEEKISKNTKAIIAVHLYGKCCDMDSILEVCNKHSLKLIEDAAQAHGAKYKNKKAGSFGDFGAFSFYPGKNLGAIGDGGAITSNSNKLDKTVKKLRNYGSEKKYYNDIIGYNSRLDEIQAGFLSIKLNKLDEINQHKKSLAKIYLDNLKDDFIKPICDINYDDVYHIFSIRHKKRDDLQKYLFKNNITTQIHYPIPPNKQLATKDFFDKENYPISQEIHDTTLSLPISYIHSQEDIFKVIEVINSF